MIWSMMYPVRHGDVKISTTIAVCLLLTGCSSAYKLLAEDTAAPLSSKQAATEPKARSVSETSERFQIGEYVVEIDRRQKPGRMYVKLENKILYQRPIESEDAYSIVRSKPPSLEGSDVDISGYPFVILDCSKPDSKHVYSVLQLSPSDVRCIDQIEMDGPDLCFTESNARGNYCVMLDERLAESGHESVMSTVYLRWQENRFVVDRNAMKKFLHDRSYRRRAARELREEFERADGSTPPQLAGEVMQYILAGRPDMGRRFLHHAWPKHQSGEQEYWKFILGEVHRTPAWHIVARSFSKSQLERLQG